MVGMLDSPNSSDADAAGKPVRIDADAWYTDADLRLILGLPGKTLQRGRRAGCLRHTRRGLVAWHLGAWVIDWLSGQEERSDAR